MDVYTKSNLIYWGGDAKDYGVAVVIEFPYIDQDVYRHLLKELRMSNFLLLQKDQMLFDGWIGPAKNFWITQESSLNTLRVTSERGFSFISNDFTLEGTITRDNLNTELTTISFYGLNLDDSILQVVLVFKARNKDVNANCFIFPITEVVQGQYRFLPINDESLDGNDY
ncbi:hypothetical protein MKY09_05220 [Psychrobacillus sp. FSL K6-4046]|uniref:hypothetical protein n=1 Tax=Psychrobacillus sp. FSL K6-4046 TaxID=2921550 RepID=UPI003159D1D0